MNKLLKSYQKQSNEKGFTLIELMIVVAIIGILAAIAIPNFLGMQEKAKRRAIEESISASKSELHNWMTATLAQEMGVVDVNGDGMVTTNEAPVGTLGAGLVQSWIAAFYSKKGGTINKPWNAQSALFTVNAGVVYTGGIDISVVNNGRGVIIRGYRISGSTIFEDSVSVD